MDESLLQDRMELEEEGGDVFLAAFGEWRCGMDEKRMCVYSPAYQLNRLFVFLLQSLNAHCYPLIPPVFSHRSRQGNQHIRQLSSDTDPSPNHVSAGKHALVQPFKYSLEGVIVASVSQTQLTPFSVTSHSTLNQSEIIRFTPV